MSELNKGLLSKLSLKKGDKLPKIPSIWQIFRKTWFELTVFWRPILGVLSVYAVLYFVIVMGMNISLNQVDSSVYELSRVNEALYQITSSLSTGGGSVSAIVQFLLFILASLAFIWTLRQLQAVKKISVLQAYYEGTATFVPALLVSACLSLTLLPLIAGSMLLTVSGEVSAVGVELIGVSLISLVLLLITIYLFAIFWPAFFIVSLPGTRPIQALKLSLKMTKTRRLALSRHVVALFFSMTMVYLLIVFPIALIVPALVGVISFILLFIFFGLGQIYFYNLYRSLI